MCRLDRPLRTSTTPAGIGGVALLLALLSRRVRRRTQGRDAADDVAVEAAGRLALADIG